MMELVRPAMEHLPSYRSALAAGWSSDTLRPQSAAEELARLTSDPTRFLAEQVDREAAGPPITLPDGSVVPRLPGYSRWMWDGEFCGVISLRWQPGTEALPPYCLGHIGYSVVPWKQRRGYAKRALQLMLPEARREGLAYVELAAAAENVASHHVIEANGGILVERFIKPAGYPGHEGLRFRIALDRD